MMMMMMRWEEIQWGVKRKEVVIRLVVVVVMFIFIFLFFWNNLVVRGSERVLRGGGKMDEEVNWIRETMGGR